MVQYIIHKATFLLPGKKDVSEIISDILAVLKYAMKIQHEKNVHRYIDATNIPISSFARANININAYISLGYKKKP